MTSARKVKRKLDMTQRPITRRQGLLIGLGGAIAGSSIANASNAGSSSADIDQTNLKWYTLEGFDHIAYHVVNVDPKEKTVDVLFKFAANEKIVLHKHHADYSTFILQGELRIYDADGSVKEIRPTASYVEKKAGGTAHTEGGGNTECIALFQNRGTDGVIYEVIGPNDETLATLGLQDFKAMWEAQDQVA